MSNAGAPDADRRPAKPASVAQGGASLIVARMLGMGCRFLLFVLLARQSEVQAGVFRSVVTFMVISELLGLLGTQRWLGVALAPSGPDRRKLFVAGTALAVVTAVALAFVYVGLSFSGVYRLEIARGILLAAIGTIPAALRMHVQTTLVGIGLSHRVGHLNFIENATDSLLAMAGLFAGFNALGLIAILVACRWTVVLASIVVISRMIGGSGWAIDRKTLRTLVDQVPRSVLIMVSFLVTRNAALVMLPALVDEREVALFAVPYQMYDLALLVPTLLALSSTYMFAARGARSIPSLRWAVAQLWTLTSVFLLPVVMLCLVFGADLLRTIFGRRYDSSVVTLYVLLLATPLMALDQVLSQATQSVRRFRADAVSTTVGAIVVAAGTTALGRVWGATGAAGALLAAIAAVLVTRYRQLPEVSPWLTLHTAWRPLVAAASAGGVGFALRRVLSSATTVGGWKWMPLALATAAVYGLLLHQLGGFKLSRRRRVRRFLLDRQPEGQHA